MTQSILSPFRWKDDPKESVMAKEKKNANQYTVGRRVNLAPMPASSFSGHIATPDESRKTNSIKRTK